MEIRPRPDYKLSAPELYKRHENATIKVTRILDILHEVEARSLAAEGQLPSWIPDWSVSLERESFRGRDDLMPLTHVSMGMYWSHLGRH